MTPATHPNRPTPFHRPGALRRFLALAILSTASVPFAIDAAAGSEGALPFEFFGFDESAYSEAGRAGLRQINSGKMFNVAIPSGLMKARSAGEARMKDKFGYDATTDEGRFYARGTLPAPARDDGGREPFLGLSAYERDGSEVLGPNCFACHAGTVNGMVVAGLGSNSMLQPSKLGSVRGDNYGQYAVWTYAARVADPEHTGLLASVERTELVELVDKTDLPPVQAMPWWLMKYKVRDYWYGDGAPDDAAHFSLNFTVASAKVNELHAEHVAATGRALAFARETVSPIYPGDLDPELVRLGADLFHGRAEPAQAKGFRACVECHGEYSRKASATDFSKPGSWNVEYEGSEALRDVGTDTAYNDTIDKFRPILDHMKKLKVYYEREGTPELYPHDDPLDGAGYVPPPLVGVWATAPYFHNGSVPTIEAVLNSELRPEIWERDKNPRAYDLAAVGMKYSEVARAEYEASAERAKTAKHELDPAGVDHTYLYDTTRFGRGNGGHTFGDSLSDVERKAVIEFLKSLSGPDM